MFNPWDALESIRRLLALPEVWQARLGPLFPAFKILCLQESARRALAVPCPNGCGCLHAVVLRHDRTGAVGICRCQPPRCPDFELTLAQITPLEVNRARLARALGQALACPTKVIHLQLPETLQFGAWSDQAIPVLLTMQTDPGTFRSVIAELAARLRRRFILFAPTSDHFNAHCLELLANVQASFFSMDATLTLTPHGTLIPKRPPAELFAADLSGPLSVVSGPSCAVNGPLSVVNSPWSMVGGPSSAVPPTYSLKKGLGMWHLVFEGKEADLKHEQGILYVAHLLLHPPEQPVHALDLMVKIPQLYRMQLGLDELADPNTGKAVALQSDARLQERNLALDDAQALRRLLRKERELEAILEAPDESEPVKTEALRELEAILEFRRRDTAAGRNAARTAANSVRRAIHRFYDHVRGALDAQGNPHPVLTRFADYLQTHVLIPSARYSGHGGPFGRTGLAGCFTHEPPEGIRWE